MTTRRRTAQQAPEPGVDLSRFPARRLQVGRTLWRFGQTKHSSPWWFVSAPANPSDPDVECGRFDAPAPYGTCYLGLDELTGVLEYIGPEWVSGGVISVDFLSGRQLYSWRTPTSLSLANLSASGAVGFRVSGELATMADYAVTQAWAAAFATCTLAGLEPRFAGIVHPSRFNPRANARVVALFGPAGASSMATQEEKPVDDELLDDLEAIGVEVVRRPTLAQMGHHER